MTTMKAARAVAQNYDDPLSCLKLEDVAIPEPPQGWVRVKVKAATLNQHDLWTLRGVGHDPKNIPITLGCDVAGVTEDGQEVICHPIIANPDAGGGDETFDPKRALFSETHDGAFAEYIVVPERNLIPKPKNLSFAEAACLPVAWGTAFRMLFGQGQLKAGDRILVQGASGGVASALIALGSAAGLRVYVTTRMGSEAGQAKADYAKELGAYQVLESGSRLPERVDAVLETVGSATWAHSLRCLRPGGAIIIAGATTGGDVSAELHRVFFQQLRVIGSTGSSRTESEKMARFVEDNDLRPRVDRELPLEKIHEGFQTMMDGDFIGKIAITFD